MAPEDDTGALAAAQSRRVAALAGFCVMAPLCLAALLLTGVHRTTSQGEVSHAKDASLEALRQQLSQETQRAVDAEASLARAREELKQAQAHDAHLDLANATAKLREEQAVSAALRKRLADAEQRARAAEEAAREAARREEAEAEGSAGLRADGPVLEWFRSSSHQYLLTLSLGTVGVLGVCGPSIFVRLFAPTAGSFLGGLLAASCATFLTAAAAGAPPGSICWLDSLGTLLSGNGQVMEYVLCGVVTLFGLLRWLFQWDCLLYAAVGDVDLEEAPPLEELNALKEPLLPALPPLSQVAEAPWVASIRSRWAQLASRMSRSKEKGGEEDSSALAGAAAVGAAAAETAVVGAEVAEEGGGRALEGAAPGAEDDGDEDDDEDSEDDTTTGESPTRSPKRPPREARQAEALGPYDATAEQARGEYSHSMPRDMV